MTKTELQEIEMEAAIYESVADPDHPMLLNVKTLLSTVRELQRQLAERDNELETERLRLAACGTAAIGYFTDCKEEYRSASLDDVLKLLKRADELQRQVQERDKEIKRLIDEMTVLHESAHPDDGPDQNAIIPARAFTKFVDAHADALRSYAHPESYRDRYGEMARMFFISNGWDCQREDMDVLASALRQVERETLAIAITAIRSLHALTPDSSEESRARTRALEEAEYAIRALNVSTANEQVERETLELRKTVETRVRMMQKEIDLLNERAPGLSNIVRALESHRKALAAALSPTQSADVSTNEKPETSR